MSANPFAVWTSLWTGGLAMARTGGQFAEMLQAAGTVVDSRTRTMAAAGRDPLNGDYRELNRMVPEKVAAFSESARAASGDLQALQGEAIAQWQAWSRIAFSGRLPTPSDVATMTARSARMLDRAAKAGGKALAPVHAQATANAKRLGK